MTTHPHVAAFPLPGQLNQNGEMICPSDYREGFHGLTKLELFTALNYAAILGKIAFDQPAENMLLKAGVKTKDFEAYAAHLARSGAEATIAELNREAKP